MIGDGGGGLSDPLEAGPALQAAHGLAGGLRGARGQESLGQHGVF